MNKKCFGLLFVGVGSMVVNWDAEANNNQLTFFAVNERSVPQMEAATPATRGAAKEVPELEQYSVKSGEFLGQ